MAEAYCIFCCCQGDVGRSACWHGVDAVSQPLSSKLVPAAVDKLRRVFRGPIVAPGDAHYEDIRRIWNAAIEKQPSLIARSTGTADVIAALRFAREQNMEVAVRGGGHNVAGTALSDGGLVIDLQPMRGIRVDPDARTLLA